MSKTKLLLFITGIVLPLLVWSQNSKSDHRLESSRYVFSPIFFPVKSFIIIQPSSDNSKINSKVNEHLILGGKIERYAPLKIMDFGLEFSYLHQNFSLYTPNEFKFNQSSLLLIPYISFKTGTEVDNIKHFIFNFGIINNYTFQNNVTYVIEDKILTTSDAPVRKFRMYGFFEIGIKKDIFYNSRWNYSKRSGQSLLSLEFLLPLFNQSYIFKYKDDRIFNRPFEPFQNNRTIPFGFTINYTQSFDLRESASEAAYRDEYSLVSSTEQWKGFPPFFHLLYAKTKYFFTPYLKLIYHPRLDSIYVDNPVEGQIYKRTSSTSYEFGYNFHMFSNISDQIGPLEKPNGFIWDLFAGLGFSNRIYLLENKSLARVSIFSLEGKIGGRVKVFKGIYLSFGYKRLLNLNKTITINNSKTSFENFSGIDNNLFFTGIGFKNSIYLHIYYRKIKQLEVENSNPIRNLEFSVGIGI